MGLFDRLFAVCSAGKLTQRLIITLSDKLLGGADVLDRMSADPRLRSVPVIVLSSKLLSLEDVKRLEHHAQVTLQSQGV